MVVTFNLQGDKAMLKAFDTLPRTAKKQITTAAEKKVAQQIRRNIASNIAGGGLRRTGLMMKEYRKARISVSRNRDSANVGIEHPRAFYPGGSPLARVLSTYEYGSSKTRQPTAELRVIRNAIDKHAGPLSRIMLKAGEEAIQKKWKTLTAKGAKFS